MRGEDVLSEKDLLGEAATIKRFEYSPLGIELKKQTESTKGQYQRLGKVAAFDKKEKSIIKK